jgi:hypothetical protein
MVVALSLTRPVVIAFTAAIVAHCAARWRQNDLTKKDLAALSLLGACCVALMWLWPTVGRLTTGVPGAFEQTHEAWRDDGTLGLFAWTKGLPNDGPTTWALLGLVMVAGIFWVVARAGARHWGPEVRGWILAYPSYIAAASEFAAPMARYLLLAFPLLWPFPEPSGSEAERRGRIAVLWLLGVMGLAAQWFWIEHSLIRHDGLNGMP